MRFVAALREAMVDDAEATRVIAPAPSVVSRVASTGNARRLFLPLLLLLLFAGGALAAILVLRDGDQKTAGPPRTIVRTITQPGTTVQQTVTTTPRKQTTPSATSPVQPSASGASLNNAGYAKMRAGDFAGARPLLEAAVQKLSGANSLDEAYADYNLAYTRFALGDCTSVLTLLDRSESIQGPRPPISGLRKDVQKRCGGKPEKGKPRKGHDR